MSAEPEDKLEKRVGRFGSIVVICNEPAAITESVTSFVDNKRTRIEYFGHSNRIAAGKLRALADNDKEFAFPFWDSSAPPRIDLTEAKQGSHFNYVFATNRTLPEGYRINTEALGLGAFAALVLRYQQQCLRMPLQTAQEQLQKATELLTATAIKADRLGGLRLRTVLSQYIQSINDLPPSDWEYMASKYGQTLHYIAETAIQNHLEQEKKLRKLQGGMGKEGYLVMVLNEPFTTESVKRITTNEPVFGIQEKERIERGILQSVNPDIMAIALRKRGDGTLTDRDETLKLSTPEERRILKLLDAAPEIEEQVNVSKGAFIWSVIREAANEAIGAGIVSANLIPVLGQLLSICLPPTYWVAETSFERFSDGKRKSYHKERMLIAVRTLHDAITALPISDENKRIEAYCLAKIASLEGTTAIVLKTDAEALVQKQLSNSVRKIFGKAGIWITEEGLDSIPIPGLTIGPLLKHEIIRMGELAQLVSYYNSIAKETGLPELESYNQLMTWLATNLMIFDENLRAFLEGRYSIQELTRQVRQKLYKS